MIKVKLNSETNRLLVICGPTSTGKTKLAIDLAKTFEGELISADSRQVYKRMNIGTGKDLPKNAKLKISDLKIKGKSVSYYDFGGVKIWGYDIVDPGREFSVSHYIEFADKIIGDIVSRKKLPILVGGTGLYIKGVVDGIESALVPRNDNLRRMLENKTVDELYEMLANLNPVKAASFNQSDRKNPRRLVRAIEIAGQNLGGIKKKPTGLITEKYNALFIGLKAPINTIEKAISSRVSKRVDLGIEKELDDLLNSGLTWNMQSMNTLGYKEWVGFFSGNKTKKAVLQTWINDEKKYVKRQMTWFKKDKRIIWFDVTIPDLVKSVEKQVKKWHNEVHAAQN